jgi:hypothetical protein
MFGISDFVWGYLAGVFSAIIVMGLLFYQLWKIVGKD